MKVMLFNSYHGHVILVVTFFIHSFSRVFPGSYRCPPTVYSSIGPERTAVIWRGWGGRAQSLGHDRRGTTGLTTCQSPYNLSDTIRPARFRTACQIPRNESIITECSTIVRISHKRYDIDLIFHCRLLWPYFVEEWSSDHMFFSLLCWRRPNNCMSLKHYWKQTPDGCLLMRFI